METATAQKSRMLIPTFRAVAVPAAALIVVNVILMYLVSLTPIAAINTVLFEAPVFGLLVYGGVLSGGTILAERGLESGSTVTAALGTATVQTAYAVFGSGVLALIAIEQRALALAITLFVTVGITIGVAAYVYRRDRPLKHWGRWALLSFIIGAALIAFGLFFSPLLIGGFLFIFLGFALRLGYEIWRVKTTYAPDRSLRHAVGVYIAFTGVFVHALQIVARDFLQH